MLESLSVRNIALIDRLSVSFGAGLIVLTGETGAGKSIIVDSLMLLLGGRADRELIRAGCDKAFVEGIFGLQDCPSAQAFLKENELEAEEGSLILSREITQSGRSVCRVCGVSLPLSRYKELTKRLMDIHGQHEHQSLMDEKQHLAQLDSFGGARHRELLAAVSAAFSDYQETARLLKKLEDELFSRQERVEFLRIRRQELLSADLTRGEEDELRKERELNKHAEKIKSRLQEAYGDIYDARSASSALDLLRSADKALSDLAALSPDLRELSERVSSLYYDVEDIGLTIQSKLETLNFDEDRMEDISARLDLIRRLSRKYGATTGDMLDYLEQITKDLSDMENSDEALATLTEKRDQKQRVYIQAASALTASRRDLASSVEKQIEKQLDELNMAGTRFTVSLTEKEPSFSGADSCAFYIAPNRGEQLKPLAQTASGGELSRLMLAIKSVSAEQALIPSMVFDEIDTGISGRAAQVVAQKMADIAKYRQVLCVTHLTQIAAMADEQFVVAKDFDGERTKTTLIPLDYEGRVAELSRMLGGADDQSLSGKIHAESLLEQANQYKAAR